MKKISRLFISCTMLASVSSMAVAQDITDFINAGVADGNKLATAYFKPYGEMLGVNLNAGWYNSAGVHKIGGFDLTFQATMAFAPTSMKTYDANSLGLQNFNVTGPSSPTLVGKGNSQTLSPKVLSGNSYADFKLPNGGGYGVFASPMIQAAVGLPLHTEILVRYMPNLDMKGYGKIGLYGLGIKHSLKNYIPLVKRVPKWQLSVLGAYTHFNSTTNVSYASGGVTSSGKMEVGADAYTFRLLTGINLPIIAFYTGVGYGNTASSFDLKGTFAGIPGNNGDTTVASPLSMNYKDSGVDFNVGTRLRLGVIAFNVDYTVGKYNTVTAGVGLSIR